MKIERRVVKKGADRITCYVLAAEPSQVIGVILPKVNILELYLCAGHSEKSFKDKMYSKLIASAKRKYGVAGVTYTPAAYSLN